MRKILAIFAVILLLSGTAFGFPHDPNPSAIQDAGGGIPGFNGFDGTWSSAFGSSTGDTLRLYNFFTEEFAKLGGPGGTNDLNIWNSPGFNADKWSQQKAAWQFMLDNPGVTVPTYIGRAMYTTQTELVNFIENLPRTNLTVEYLGEIPRGFPFPFLIFSKNTDRTPAGLAATGKPLVWVQGNIHGDETSGPEGCLTLANDLARGRYDSYLDKVNVILIPRVCADGAKAPRRESRDLLALQWTPQPEARDLNRDNMLLDLPVTRAMRKMFLAYGPHFCADLHERSGSSISATITNTFGVKIDNDGGDIGSSGTTILQGTRELIRLRYEYMEPALAKLAEPYGVTFGLYREGTDTIAHGVTNNFGTSWASTAATRWARLDGDKWPPAAGPNRGPYWEAEYSNTFVNNTAWDPDAPYYVIPEAYYNNRSSRNINAMPGVVSQLFENKGPGARLFFERRVATGYLCALSIIKTAAEQGDEILPKIMEIRKNFVEKGKTVSTNDMVPILVVQPRPMHWNAGSDQVKGADGTNYLPDFGYAGREVGYTVVDLGLANVTDPKDLSAVVRYDGTKAVRSRVPNPTSSADYEPLQGGPSPDGYHQVVKFEHTWLGWALRERIRPYAYIFEGPYANELATRMMIAGINVKRLAQDTAIDVEGWKYNQPPYVDLANSGTNGWLNRDITMYEIPGRQFKKDAYVVYLGQLASNLISMYFEPDLPWNVASCIFLPYMSVAAGGASTRDLSAALVGVEMPAYRYLKEVDLPTYDLDHFLPLVNRGAVARFFNYQTQESIAAVAAATGEEFIKVYEYDFQVHTRTNALVNGRFNITLPTSENTKGYLILKKDGTYEELKPLATKMAGWNIGTVVVADHGVVPFTVDLTSVDMPVVGDGSNRTVPRALPANDDLIGVRIVEIVTNEFAEMFKDGKLPPNAVITPKGIKYTDLFTEKGTLLSNAMLDGWIIVGVTPQSGPGWKVNIVNGELVVTFTKEVYDEETVTVTLQKVGSTETKEMDITFSGEHESLIDKLIDLTGCNAGVYMLALLALFPLFIRRRG
ncbi:MAG: hypothetical protein FWH52_03455 [Synergistaceae bacterium]|nr:hypothetical protein [Synergistaceae bacterium]